MKSENSPRVYTRCRVKATFFEAQGLSDIGDKQMRFKKQIAAAATVLLAIAVCWATPGSGILFNNILNVGRTVDNLRSNVGGEAADGSKWHVQLKTEGAPSDIVVQDLALAPGAYGGWHSHPGPVIITVQQGIASFYETDCVRHDYPAGTAFIEDGDVVHNLRNESATEALRVFDTFIIPAGAPRRIEQPQPSTCGLP